MSLLLDALKQAEKSKEKSSKELDINVDDDFLVTDEPCAEKVVPPSFISSGITETKEPKLVPAESSIRIEDKDAQIATVSVSDKPLVVEAKKEKVEKKEGSTVQKTQTALNPAMDVFAVGSQTKRMLINKSSMGVIIGFIILAALVIGWFFWPSTITVNDYVEESTEVIEPINNVEVEHVEVVTSLVGADSTASIQPDNIVRSIKETVADLSNALIDKPSASASTKRTVQLNSGISIAKGKTSRNTLNELSSAYSALKREDFMIAEQGYRKVLKRHPNQIDAKLGLANIAARKGFLDEARTLYDEVLKQDESNKVAQLGLLYTYRNQNSDAMLRTLKEMNDKFEGQPEIISSLGHQLAKQKKWQSAQSYYFKAFELDNLNPLYAYNLAVSLDQMGKYRTAITFYKKTLELLSSSNTSIDQVVIQRRIKQLGE